MQLTYANGQDRVVTLVLEPWAYSEPVVPGSRVRMTFELAPGEQPDIHVDHEPDGAIMLSVPHNLVEIAHDDVPYWRFAAPLP